MAQTKVPFTGGCACGAIRYECNAEPVMMLKCHCRDCQQLTGGGFAPAVFVPSEAFRVRRGQLHYHFTPSIAGGNTSAVSVPNVGRELPELNPKRAIRHLSESWLPAWTMLVGFSRKWIFSFWTGSRGTK
jgi:hypothetical protein